MKMDARFLDHNLHLENWELLKSLIHTLVAGKEHQSSPCPSPCSGWEWNWSSSH